MGRTETTNKSRNTNGEENRSFYFFIAKKNYYKYKKGLGNAHPASKLLLFYCGKNYYKYKRKGLGNAHPAYEAFMLSHLPLVTTME
jgi:hypothetical protein